MLKIHQLFFRSFLTLFVFIFMVISIVTYYWSKSFYLEEVEKSIISNIDTLAIALEDLEGIEGKIFKIKKATNLRITIIDEKGLVIAETDENKEIMENHLNRVEVIKAKYNHYGKVIRHSETINRDLLYIAKEITINGKIYYLRISKDINQIQKNFIELTLQIIGIIFIFLALAFFISYSLSKKIQRDTTEILKDLINLTKSKDLIHDKSKYLTDEFNTINKLLYKVSLKLSRKEEIKAKHTAKLKLANKQKDEIISAISHEFKNPIAVIQGYCETILNDKEIPNKLRIKFLQKIEQNAKKMTKIVDKLRLTLKLEEGQEKIQAKNCDLTQICNTIVSDLSEKYPNREVIVIGSYTNMIADDTLLTIVLENLIENALKYSEDEVIVKLENHRITVQDKGIGINEQELDKITSKFYRVSHNTWNNSLGLGLFIVQTIIKLHNFKLEIHSTEHVGSEFIIKY